MSKLIPVTILTGFLGSGKTTLLKRILTEQHGMKIAVIENEFGEENIDNDILVQDGNEQIVQMSNGCICCTIRGDLVAALSDLLTRRDKGELQFDRVVIETTGVANPGPVAQTFFMDDEIAARYLLDAVITLVDAKHGNQQLDKQEEAQRQVGFADAIFITKGGLVSDDDVEALRHRLLHMNPRAPIRTANFGEAPIDTIFDLRGFNLNAKLEIDPTSCARTTTITTTVMSTTTPARPTAITITSMATITITGTAITTITATRTIPTASPRSSSAANGRSTTPSWRNSSPACSTSTARSCCATRACCTWRASTARWCSRACTS